MTAARVHVVAGVIYNVQRDKVLIARRPLHKHQGGLWEFPGGKVGKNESVLAALARELSEELAITVVAAAHLLTTDHDYADRRVRLETWSVTEFAGLACGNEGQQIVWAPLDELRDYAFPPANRDILARITEC